MGKIRAVRTFVPSLVVGVEPLHRVTDSLNGLHPLYTGSYSASVEDAVRRHDFVTPVSSKANALSRLDLPVEWAFLRVET